MAYLNRQVVRGDFLEVRGDVGESFFYLEDFTEDEIEKVRKGDFSPLHDLYDADIDEVSVVSGSGVPLGESAFLRVPSYELYRWGPDAEFAVEGLPTY